MYSVYHHGTPYNVTFGVPGPLAAGGTAAQFNGTSSYIAIDGGPNAAANQPHLTVFNDAFAVEGLFWFNATQTGNPRLLANAHSGYGNYGLDAHVQHDLSNFAFDFTNPVFQVNHSTVAIPAGEWVHLMGTYEAGSFAIYVNGTLSGSGTTTPTGPVNASPDILNIGRNPSYDGDYFVGYAAEVALYLSAPSAARVQAHVNAISSPNPDAYPAAVLADNPRGYWRLNDAAGATVVRDWSQFTRVPLR